MPQYSVSIVKCADYQEESVAEAVDRSISLLGGLKTSIHAGDRVLVKLNLLASRPPEDAVTTHPAVVKAIVEMLQDLGAIPMVGDSPGGRSSLSSYRALLERTGIRSVIDETGCDLADFDSATVDISSPAARTYKKFTVAKVVLDADAVICLPKLKTHQLTMYTGAVKLLYGYLPGVQKTEYHLHTADSVDRFAELLLDLSVTLPPLVYVMDAVIGMEGNGPSHGIPRNIGLIMASQSGTALDLVASTLIGFEPEMVPTIRNAILRGIGPPNLQEVSILGERIENASVPDFKRPNNLPLSRIPPFFIRATQRLFAARPVISDSACTRCGACAENCPPHAISSIPGAMPRIDYGRCIRCFCCQELCPAGAVEVKKPILRQFIR
jgi:uncharacterized protein (DUF362 family)/Pyruvate/2-oxoacid:ferredoxin oxidoreductase delta subunit